MFCENTYRKSSKTLDIIQIVALVMMVLVGEMACLHLLSLYVSTTAMLLTTGTFVGISLYKRKLKTLEIAATITGIVAIAVMFAASLIMNYWAMTITSIIAMAFMLATVILHAICGVRAFKRQEYMQLELVPAILFLANCLTMFTYNFSKFNATNFLFYYIILSLIVNYVIARKRDDKPTVVEMSILCGLAFLINYISLLFDSPILYTCGDVSLNVCLLLFHIINVMLLKNNGKYNIWSLVGLGTIVIHIGVYWIPGMVVWSWFTAIGFACFFASQSNVPKKYLALVGLAIILNALDVHNYNVKRVHVTTSEDATEIVALQYAFHDLRDIIIGDNIEKIGEYAFFSSGLKEITIPESVKEIDKCAFDMCESLEKITLEGFTKLNDNVFGYFLDYKPATIYVHGKYIEIYKKEYPEYKFEAID